MTIYGCTIKDDKVIRNTFSNVDINSYGFYVNAFDQICRRDVVDTEIPVGYADMMFFSSERSDIQVFVYFARYVDKKIKDFEAESKRKLFNLNKEFDKICDKIEELDNNGEKFEG